MAYFLPNLPFTWSPWRPWDALTSILDSAFLGGFASAWPSVKSIPSDSSLPLGDALCNDVLAALWTIWDADFSVDNIPEALHQQFQNIENSRQTELSKLLLPMVVPPNSSQTEFKSLAKSNVVAIMNRWSSRSKLQHKLTRLVHAELYVTILRTLSEPNDVLSKFHVARFLSQSTSECMLWSRAIPTSPDLLLSPGAMRLLVRYFTGLPIPGFERIQHLPCTCTASLGHEGHHLLACYRTFAHDKMVRVLHAMCRTSRLVSEVEPIGVLSGERRPDILVSNLRPNEALLLDFTTVDPTREASIGNSWHTPGYAMQQRETEKTNSYNNQYNPALYSFSPLVMEISGRMSSTLKTFLKSVAAFACRHLQHDGVGQARFKSRFGFFWQTKLNVTFLKSLAASALLKQQEILDTIPATEAPVEFNIDDDIY
jgi:hypothetical protein